MAAALLLERVGAEPRVTDNTRNAEVEKNAEELSKRNIRFELGGHTASFLRGSELVVASPGVPNTSLAVKWSEENNVSVIGEIELAYSYCRAPVIAISGTNGKSTVTALTGRIMAAAGKKVMVGGNIGNPFSGEVLDLGEDSVAVLEISSFQLERIKSFRPKISCLLNISQDHLDRYKSMDEYFDVKKRIFLNQEKEDYAILNYDLPKIKTLDKAIEPKPFYFSRHRLSKEYEGAYVDNGQVLIRRDNKFKWVANLEELNIEGSHNLSNYLASVSAAFLMGVEPERMRETVSGFKPLPHRFETVDIIDGVRFIDDSKATNVDSVIKALDCCKSQVILIAGGLDKGSDYRALIKPVKGKVKELILIGEAKEKIAKSIGEIKPVHFADSLGEAVRRAHRDASRGDTILLSPLCASFDMFRDYKERGEVFRKAVKALKE